MIAHGFIRKCIAVMLMTCCACSSDRETEAAPRGSLTTNTDSRSLPDAKQRVAFLARYLRLKSPITDAAFIVRYQDNSRGGVPGPSDWDIRAVLQVEDDVSAWRAGWVPCSGGDRSDAGPPGVDLAWAEPLLERRARWRTLRSSPRCYRNPRSAGSFAVLYEEDGVVLYRNTSERALLDPS